MKPTPNISSLILGGARSGKSRFAQQIAEDSGKEVIYIATANILDDEIAARVKHHQTDRPANWQTLEEPLHLALTLQQWASPERILLVDCLTMWLTNLLMLEEPDQLRHETDLFLNTVTELDCPVILVSNEVGMGIIPTGELTRHYVDEAGRLHQQIAQRVDQVILMVAGLPHWVKPEPRR
jgi:adenosylcobinamide kinase/adenosylcobinamide-phosphate guanylyltransferase